MSDSTFPQFENMMVAHGDGADATMHKLGEPCALCRPPIVITDEMVERALRAHGDTWYAACEDLPGRLSVWADRNKSPEIMRAALEAALNG